MRLSLGSPPNVEKYARKGKIDGLVRALRYEDLVTDRDGRVFDLGATVRAGAAHALAQLDSPQATSALVHSLSDPLEAVRIAAVRGLRERGGDDVAECLMAAVVGWTLPDYAAARADALEAVLSLQHPEALRLTTGAFVIRPYDLEESDLAVVRKLADSAYRADLDATVRDLIGRLEEDSEVDRARRLLVTLAPASTERLIEALDDRRSQRVAALALGEIHDSRSVPPLSAVLLDSADDDVRAAAAWALGEIRHPSAVEALLVATGDDDYEVRTTAADSFDKLGNAAIALATHVLVTPALANGTSGSQAALSPEQPAPAAAPVPAEQPTQIVPSPRTPVARSHSDLAQNRQNLSQIALASKRLRSLLRRIGTES